MSFHMPKLDILAAVTIAGQTRAASPTVDRRFCACRLGLCGTSLTVLWGQSRMSSCLRLGLQLYMSHTTSLSQGRGSSMLSTHGSGTQQIQPRLPLGCKRWVQDHAKHKKCIALAESGSDHIHVCQLNMRCQFRKLRRSHSCFRCSRGQHAMSAVPVDSWHSSAV